MYLNSFIFSIADSTISLRRSKTKELIASILFLLFSILLINLLLAGIILGLSIIG